MKAIGNDRRPREGLTGYIIRFLEGFWTMLVSCSTSNVTTYAIA
jgi:hypothetical protein